MNPPVFDPRALEAAPPLGEGADSTANAGLLLRLSFAERAHLGTCYAPPMHTFSVKPGASVKIYGRKAGIAFEKENRKKACRDSYRNRRNTIDENTRGYIENHAALRVGNSVLSHPPGEPATPMLSTELQGDEEVSANDDDDEEEEAAPEDVAKNGDGMNEDESAHVGDL
ncbi:hypothetical protein BOTBODRAFT_48008 [Botryobasidium botryosum FD-172 SS1]|uniref:Uncharacterized protein n=1 Tax=Botryobasidium botryosum (strain FD-172 SS1) TaxID=930990 RepID=A0A067LZP6_BOTB1|nr:hypothetical protein BOTBODRAFT_48008 [Botryobasidium botryosum FD-172 SS1]